MAGSNVGVSDRKGDMVLCLLAQDQNKYWTPS